ncbi:hypothetical protein NDU88_006258 [Pleurodeles waltl]|nr:hypothetical protein NDU88_006258 [Pleurodeles waltl]
MAWSRAAFRPLGSPALRTPKPVAWSRAAFRPLGSPALRTPKPMAWSTAAFRPLGAPCAAHPETNGVEYCGLPTPRSPLRCAPRNQWRGVLLPSDP